MNSEELRCKRYSFKFDVICFLQFVQINHGRLTNQIHEQAIRWLALNKSMAWYLFRMRVLRARHAFRACIPSTYRVMYRYCLLSDRRAA